MKKIFILISAILFLSSSAFAELDDFDVAETLLMQGKAKLAYPLATAHAKNLNTYESYRTFVRKFPNTPEAAEAMTRIQEIAFVRAKEENTSAIFDRFIITFPHAPQTEHVRKLAYQAEQHELETELGEGVQRTSLGGGSPQEKREIACPVRIENLSFLNADSFGLPQKWNQTE